MLHRQAHAAGPGIFDEGHAEALLELAARRRRIDGKLPEILVPPTLLGMLLHRCHQPPDEIGRLAWGRQRTAALAWPKRSEQRFFGGLEKFAILQLRFPRRASGPAEDAGRFHADVE